MFCEMGASAPAVLQVLRVDDEGVGRYRCVLSDGKCSFPCVFDAEALEQPIFSTRDRLVEGLPQPRSIVRVSDYMCPNHPGQRSTKIVILRMKLLASESELIRADWMRIACEWRRYATPSTAFRALTDLMPHDRACIEASEANDGDALE